MGEEKLICNVCGTLIVDKEKYVSFLIQIESIEKNTVTVHNVEMLNLMHLRCFKEIPREACDTEQKRVGEIK